MSWRENMGAAPEKIFPPMDNRDNMDKTPRNLSHEQTFVPFVHNVHAKQNSKTPETDRQTPGVETMVTCLHGRPCRHLKTPRGERPLCSLSGVPVFDTLTCPLGFWSRAQQRQRRRRHVSPTMIRTWRQGRKWVLEHLEELQATGWTRRELFRAGRFSFPCGSWGFAWFFRLDAEINIEQDGTLTMIWRHANGQQVKQTF